MAESDTKITARSGRPGSVYIASLATAVPPCNAEQALVAELIRSHFGPQLSRRSLGLIRSTFAHPGIRKRHFAIDDPARVMVETADQRIERFTAESVALAGRAVGEALELAGVGLKDVRALVVNSCTGYICPGISTYLVERLGLSRTIGVYDLVGGGCGGAIPNLQLVEALLKANGGVVVSVSVEICSATFQMGNDASLILSNALFGDGAAAAVLWDRPQGLELVASAGRLVPEQRESIRYVHRDGQLHNQLSRKLPGLVKEAATRVVVDLLESQGLTTAQIGHWALHTGGEKIINAVRDGIGIPEERLRATRAVLAEYGNMSSPTVWFVLKEILDSGMPANDLCVMLAYGAGLSAHSFLLRKV